MTAKYGFNTAKLQITSVSTTTTFNDISNYIDTISGLDLEAMVQDSHAMGDSWTESLFTGTKKFNTFTIEGFYDDTAATGPHALFGAPNALGAERVIKFSPDGTAPGTANAIKSDVIIQKYMVKPTRNDLTRFTLTLVPTGAVTSTT